MGVVVAAVQVDLERPVALKFLLPRVLERPDHVARFAREGRAAAKLESEHVTRVLDVGALDNGAAYIVMEYLDGEDLGRVLERRGPLPCEEAVGYVLEASEAVAEAHSLGIVHRDLKPANLFLANRTSGRPIIKVLDFGLSKVSTGDEQHVTSESSILGSPLYMSPEQLLSARTADTRSDIWSLGVALYELLTARHAFPGDKMPKLVAAILHGREEPLQSLRPDLPSALCAVVHRCLQKDPSKRYADVAHFAKALAPFGPPSSQASVDRISHVLERSVKTPIPPDDARVPPPLPEAKALGVADTTDASAPGESLPGASRSVTLPSFSPAAASATAPRARKGMRTGGIVGSIAVLATAGAIVAVSRPTSRSGDAPSTTGSSVVPSRTAAGGAFLDRDLARPAAEPPALASAAIGQPVSSAPLASASVSTRPPPPKAVPQERPNVSRDAATASPSNAPASPAPSAASSTAPSPPAAVDPLAKLKRL